MSRYYSRADTHTAPTPKITSKQLIQVEFYFFPVLPTVVAKCMDLKPMSVKYMSLKYYHCQKYQIYLNYYTEP